MCQIEAVRLFPIKSEFVLMAAGGNVRVAAGLHVRIDANRNRGDRGAALLLLCGFFQQRFELGFRLDIEKENSRACAASIRSVAERFADFFAHLADAGEGNSVATHADALEVQELAAGNDIEAAAQFREMLQNREIAVGLHSEAECVRQSAETVDELVVRVFDRAPAIDVGWRPELIGNVAKGHAVAGDCCIVTRVARQRLPEKVWREAGGVHERQLLAGVCRRAAHRTLSTTRVRSSESGADCENQSTSRRTRSANSAAPASCLSSISLRKRSVPKNWPSVLVVSAMPSE